MRHALENTMTLDPGFHTLWPTPVAVHRKPAAAELDPLLARVFGAGEAERIILSFNASIHAAGGDRRHDYSAR
jgi:hypothetical protein